MLIKLNNRLKTARESLGKSQKEMAELLGIGLKSWQVYEQGTSVPGGNVFEALVKLGFNANWLLMGEGEMKRGETDSYRAHQAGLAADPVQQYLPPDAETVELLLMLKRYGNRALIDDLKARLLKIKAAMEG